MTTWKDGGDSGRIYREIVNEAETHVIAKVRIRRSAPYRPALNPTRPWPEGEANFHLILAAPETAEALGKIAHGAIVSPEQPPEKVAEQVLRVLQLVREQNCEYFLLISAQQRWAERAKEALEAIRDQAECFLQPLPASCTSRVRWEVVRDRAIAAIAAAKGEDSEKELA